MHVNWTLLGPFRERQISSALMLNADSCIGSSKVLQSEKSRSEKRCSGHKGFPFDFVFFLLVKWLYSVSHLAGMCLE